MNLKNEPSVVIGAITAFLIVVVNAVVLFGLNLSVDQTTAVISVINAGGALAGALFIREKVFSPATVEKVAGNSLGAVSRLRKVDTGNLTGVK